MAFTQNEFDKGVEFAKSVSFTAEMDPDKYDELKFSMQPDFPKFFSDRMKETIQSCADYYYRSLFFGEYEPRRDAEPFPEFKDIVEEINFKLDYFKEAFIIEVEKSMGSEKISLTPFDQVMLNHKRKQVKAKSEALKKANESK